ncbi:MAG TPA: hypothetical protein PL033_15210 [Candidatus Brocadiia bacterium]|nr:hypothetical protein [Candidatus Brocadiia bacterium]
MGKMLQYAKTAFLWRWNLLFFGTGVVFSFLSGAPSQVLPIVTALELAYMGTLYASPRFRKAVDAAGRPKRRQPTNDELMTQIRETLTGKEWTRFQALRNRCESLNAIGRQLRGPGGQEDDTAIGDMRREALDRLLWMFLKLLLSKNALDRFLATADTSAIRKDMADCEGQLAEARKQNRNEALLRAMEDKLDTMRQRLANFEQAGENRDTVQAELDRVEQKIAAVSEGTLSANDPGAFSAQVDGIAAGITIADEAVRGLDAPLHFQDDTPPTFLREAE